MSEKIIAVAATAARLALEAASGPKGPDGVSITVVQMGSHALQLHRIAERLYRVVLAYSRGDVDLDAWERAKETAIAKASPIAEQYDATVSTSGDPRGFVLRLTLRSGASNSFDGKTWGIVNLWG